MSQKESERTKKEESRDGQLPPPPIRMRPQLLTPKDESYLTEPTVNLKEHPIMLTLRDVISGDGFLAGITLSGRALMRQEDGAWWMYGVRPAAIAEYGETIEEAFSRFRNRYKEVLFDFAQENRDFDQFKAAVEQFFYETDADSEDEHLWEEALTSPTNQLEVK